MELFLGITQRSFVPKCTVDIAVATVGYGSDSALD